MCEKAVETYLCALLHVPSKYRTQQMIEKSVLKKRRKLLFVLNRYNTQNICKKEMKSDFYCYNILEMYKKDDDGYLYAWEFP